MVERFGCKVVIIGEYGKCPESGGEGEEIIS